MYVALVPDLVDVVAYNIHPVHVVLERLYVKALSLPV
jgi:hypothetical protein